MSQDKRQTKTIEEAISDIGRYGYVKRPQPIQVDKVFFHEIAPVEKQMSDTDPKCEVCGETDYSKLEYGPDPYAQEVRGDETFRWMCQHCLESSAQDI